MKKIFFNLVNTLEWLWKAYIASGRGLLHHKKDKRDKRFDFGVSTVIKQIMDYGYQFRQSPFYICVFASRELGRSQQDGVRWSVRWFVKCARRQGMTKGNGYSYLRAANEIAYHTGRIPEVLMKDDIGAMSWEEYSRWTPDDEALLPIAKTYSLKENNLFYREIKNDTQADIAFTRHQVVFTALSWYSGMNIPKPMRYILEWVGKYIGGHAVCFTGNTEDGLYCNHQTFGKGYGQNGKAFTRGLMKNIIAGAYVEDNYNSALLASMVQRHYVGKVVRDIDAPECYMIEPKGKRHIQTIDEYMKLGGKHLTVAKHIIDLIPNV